MTVTFGKIQRLVSIAVIAFNLNAGQSKQLDYYVRANQQEWIDRLRSEAEVEQAIKSEARRIAG